MKGKPTKAQVQLRTEEILRIRLDGAEFWDVREYVREKEQEEGSVWQLPEGGKPLSDPTLWRYIGLADELVKASCLSSRKKLLRRHLAQRRNLFAKAVSAGDYRTALAVAKDEAELQGLYPPTKVSADEPEGRQGVWRRILHRRRPPRHHPRRRRAIRAGGPCRGCWRAAGRRPTDSSRTRRRSFGKRGTPLTPGRPSCSPRWRPAFSSCAVANRARA